MSVGAIRALCREPLLRGVESLAETLEAIDAPADGPLETDDCRSGLTPEILNRIESTMRDVFTGTQALIARL